MATLVAYLNLLTGTAGDDVLDIFDVVFGDLQRAATHRGQRRRASELRDYDRAVAELHTRMRGLLAALDDPDTMAVTGVLDQLRGDRSVIDTAMSTVEQLMRPPGDPFHERLVAVYPQIRRFLPLFIEAFELASIPAAAPVLDAYQALEQWLTQRPRTTTLPAAQLPLQVVTPSWERHVRTPEGSISRAG